MVPGPSVPGRSLSGAWPNAHEEARLHGHLGVVADCFPRACDSRVCLGGRPPWGAAVSLLDWTSLTVVVGIAVYLIVALLKPELFQ